MRQSVATFLPQEYANPGNLFDFKKPYAVAPSLIRRIHAYDPNLVIYYETSTARYCIARKTASGGLHFICHWQDPETRAFRPLDMRLYDALRSWDMRPPRVDAPRTADAYVDAEQRDADARAEKSDTEFDDDIGYLTRENRRQLRRSFEPSI